MAKKKSRSMRFALSWIGILLSLLLMTTFFMPIYQIDVGTGEQTKYVSLSGLELMEGITLTETDLVNLTTQVGNGEIDADTYLKKVAAYGMSQSDYVENKIATVASLIAAILGLIGVVFSIVALIRGGLGVGGIVTGVLMTLVSLAFIIPAFLAANRFTYTTINIAPWLALASSVLFLGCSIAGLVLKRRSVETEK